MNPLLLVALLGGGAVVLSAAGKKNLAGSRKKGSYVGMNTSGELVVQDGKSVLPPIDTFDLVRIASRIITGMPTPWYPKNVERFNKVIERFNEGTANEAEARLAAASALWDCAVVGLNGEKEVGSSPIDLVKHLERAKRGDFMPDVNGKKVWDYWEQDKAEYLAAYWPMALGKAKYVNVGGPSKARFVAELALALIADPMLTMVPGVRDRTARVIECFLQAIAVPECSGTLDGHSYDSILGGGATICPSMKARATNLLQNALKGWRNGCGLKAENEPALVSLTDYSKWGSEAQQLKLIKELSKNLRKVLIDKFVVWPGGPASKVVMDWGLFALLYLGAIGMSVAIAVTGGAATPGISAVVGAAAAAGGGMVGLATKASAAIEESKDGQKTGGGRAAAAALSTSLGVYQKVS